MTKHISALGLFLIFSGAVLANQMGFSMMAGQGLPGQMLGPNAPVAMDAGAYQSQFQGTGDVPPWAIQQGHLCSTGRSENTNNFNFGQGQRMPSAPGVHQYQ